MRSEAGQTRNRSVSRGGEAGLRCPGWSALVMCGGESLASSLPEAGMSASMS